MKNNNKQALKAKKPKARAFIKMLLNYLADLQSCINCQQEFPLPHRLELTCKLDAVREYSGLFTPRSNDHNLTKAGKSDVPNKILQRKRKGK